jgi:energy-coupling factor transport system permease protein
MPTLAWMAWVALVMAVGLSTTNPYYLGIVLTSVIAVAALAPKTGAAIAGFRALLVFGLILLAGSLVVAVINGNFGSHVLFTIPGPDIPGWLGGLRIGGPVSAEGLVAAVIRGLAIMCVLLAFGVFNGAVSPHRVLRTAPAALFHAGLVVTVGLTLLPSSVEDVRRIREMRALRGASTGVRNLPALIVPAVIGGLERSMRLAEAMEARGYGSAPAPARAPRLLGALSAPLLLLAASAWFYYPWAKPYAALAAALGVGALLFWGWSASRTRQTTRLHTERVSRVDAALAVSSLFVAIFAVVGGSAGWVDTKYNPFAGLQWPGFTLAGGLLALACAWPALRLALAEQDAAEREPAVAADATAGRAIERQTNEAVQP